VNLKIKSGQSFKDVHIDMVYVYIFIKVSTHECMSIYIYTVLHKKRTLRCSVCVGGVSSLTGLDFAAVWGVWSLTGLGAVESRPTSQASAL
jgi:hypothetical protein